MLISGGTYFNFNLAWTISVSPIKRYQATRLHIFQRSSRERSIKWWIILLHLFKDIISFNIFIQSLLKENLLCFALIYHLLSIFIFDWFPSFSDFKSDIELWSHTSHERVCLHKMVPLLEPPNMLGCDNTTRFIGYDSIQTWSVVSKRVQWNSKESTRQIALSITRCDLSTTIVFKFIDSYLIAFEFAQ